MKPPKKYFVVEAAGYPDGAFDTESAADAYAEERVRAGYGPRYVYVRTGAYAIPAEFLNSDELDEMENAE